MEENSLDKFFFKQKRILGILLVSLLFLLQGCGNNSLYEANLPGYTTVYSVDGVSFDMPDVFLNGSTNISEISNKVNYENGSFLWKSSNSQYMMFDINQVVVAVNNRTKYQISKAKDIENCIKKNDLSNIWFSAPGKKLQYETDKHKIIATVCAEVSITNTLYGQFVGKLSNVYNEEYECSMFVGVPGSSYEELSANQKSTIEHMAKSLQLEQETGLTEISESENINSSQEMPESSHEEKNFVDESLENEKQVAETEEVQENTVESVLLDTESFDQKNENITYSHDAPKNYNMLNIGEIGTLTALDEKGTIQTENIVITGVKTGDEAEAFIADFALDSNSRFVFEAPPEGYSWHLISYETQVDPKELYVDIRLEDFNGQKLRDMLDMEVTARTHDIFLHKSQGGIGTCSLYCFYLVPNNCTEYMIECGTRMSLNGDATTACYKVTL